MSNKVVLMGCGTWGRNILRDLLHLGCEVHVIDPDAGAREAALDAGASAATERSTGLRPDGVIVATPASLHYASVVHGARGNLTAGRRRALSLRYVGDDARYVMRPGRTSPPFPDHGMRDGERLREDWFPVVWVGEAPGSATVSTVVIEA